MNSFLLLSYSFCKKCISTATETNIFVFFGMRKHSASWIWREAKRRLRPLWLEPDKLQVEVNWSPPRWNNPKIVVEAIFLDSRFRGNDKWFGKFLFALYWALRSWILTSLAFASTNPGGLWIRSVRGLRRCRLSRIVRAGWKAPERSLYSDTFTPGTPKAV
jgi:hypothetical protein